MTGPLLVLSWTRYISEGDCAGECFAAPAQAANDSVRKATSDPFFIEAIALTIRPSTQFDFFRLRLLYPIEKVPAERMAFLETRVIEIVARIVAHAQALHNAL